MVIIMIIAYTVSPGQQETGGPEAPILHTVRPGKI